MEIINSVEMDVEKAQEIGALKRKLKELNASVADTVRAFLIRGMWKGETDLNVWPDIAKAYNLHDYKATAGEQLETWQKDSATTYNTFHKAFERAVKTFAPLSYDGQTIVDKMDLASITRDSEYNGTLDMQVCLANWKSEVTRRKSIFDARVKVIQEREAQARAASAITLTPAELQARIDSEIAKAMEAVQS